jgi:hypothetical protein
MNRLIPLLTAAALAQPSAAADPPAKMPPSVREIEDVLQQMEEKARLSAAKLEPGCRGMMRQWGRCEALAAVVADRREAAERQARRAEERAAALGGVSGLKPETVAAVTDAAKRAKAEAARLASAEADVRAELRRVKSAFLDRVIRGSVAPPDPETAKVLDRVKEVLDPPSKP